MAMAGCGDHFTGLQQLSTVSAVNIAGVAVLGAGCILCVSDFGVVVGEFHFHILRGAGSGIVEFQIGNGEVNSIGIQNIEHQCCDHFICCDASQADKAEGNHAVCLIHGNVIAVDQHIAESHSCGVEGHRHNAVVGQSHILGSDLHGDSAFVIADGDAASILGIGQFFLLDIQLIDLVGLGLDGLISQLLHQVVEYDAIGLSIGSRCALMQTANGPYTFAEGAQTEDCKVAHLVDDIQGNLIVGVSLECRPEEHASLCVIVQGVEVPCVTLVDTRLLRDADTVRVIVVRQGHTVGRQVAVNFLIQSAIGLHRIYSYLRLAVILEVFTIANSDTNQIAVILIHDLQICAGGGINANQIGTVSHQQSIHAGAVHVGCVCHIREEDVQTLNQTIRQFGYFISLGIDGIQAAGTIVGVQRACVDGAVGGDTGRGQIVNSQQVAAELVILGQLCGVEGAVPDGTAFVPNQSIQIHSDIDNTDVADGSNRVIQLGAGDDLYVTGSDCQHLTIFVHHCHALVGGSPDDITVRCIDRKHNSAQLGSVALLQNQAGVGDFNGGNFIQHFANLGVDFVGGAVHGIVIDLQQEAGAVNLAQIQNILTCLACYGIHLGAFQHIDILAILVQQSHSGHILVVSNADVQRVVEQTQSHVIQDGSSVIHSHVHIQSRTVAQSGPIHIAVLVNIVLGDQGNTHIQQGVLGHIGGAHIGGQFPVSVLPNTAVDVEIGGADSAQAFSDQVFTGGGIYDVIEGSCGITDGGKADGADHIAIGCADGVTLGHINSVLNDGVATEVVFLQRIIAVADKEAIYQTGVVHIALVQVGSAVLFAGELILLVRALIEHGRIGPVAVEAQNGDGVGGALYAFRIHNALCIDIAFQICAVFIVCQPSFVIFAQSDGDFHIGRAVGCNHSAALAQHLEEQVCVVGVDSAVGIQVGCSGIGDLCCYAGGIVQQDLAVSRVDISVAIEVHTEHIRAAYQFLTVNGEGDNRIQDAGSGIQIQRITVCKRILGEDVSVQCVGLLTVGEVVDGEGEGVNASTVGVIAQFYLDLAVGIGIGSVGIHQNVGICAHSCANVGQTGALLQNRVVAAGFGIDHRNSGGHQQALCQRTGIQAGEFTQIVFTDVLCDQRCHTSHLRCGHGGTAHQLVGYVIGNTVSVSTGNRQDCAAGSGDLRLQNQAAGNTPAGEAAHGVGSAVQESVAALCHIDSAGPVQDIVFLIGHGVELEILAVCHCQGDNRCIVGITGQVQGDQTFLVVDDHNADGAILNSSVGLLVEGSLATIAQGDLAGENFFAQSCKLLFRADTVQEYEFLITGQGQQGGITESNTIAANQHFDVGDILTIDGHISGDIACVVSGSNCQGVGVATGVAAGLHAHVIQIHVGNAILGVIHPCTGITGRHDHDHAALFQIIHNGLVFGVGIGGEAGVAAAQGQVDGIRAQQDSVFNGCHIVSLVSAAVGAKDLHNQDLCIGGNTLHMDGVQRADEATVFTGDVGIGGSDTGNMGAMLALIVVQVGNIVIAIHIVEAEGDLCIDVHILSSDVQTVQNIQLGQHSGDLFCIQQIQSSHVVLNGEAGLLGQQAQRILVSSLVKGLVINVQTGINDSDSGACTGITGCVTAGSAGLHAGSSHIGVCSSALNHIRLIQSFDDNVLNTADTGDGLNLTVLHIGRDQVSGQSQIPNNIQLFLGDILDLGDHRSLFICQLAPISHGNRVLCQALYGIACVKHAGRFQENGYTDNICRCILTLVAIELYCVLAKQIGRNAIVAYLRKLDTGCTCAGGKNPGRNDTQHQDYRKQSLENVVVPHICYLFH